jgi:hypothetical protein
MITKRGLFQQIKNLTKFNLPLNHFNFYPGRRDIKVCLLRTFCEKNPCIDLETSNIDTLPANDSIEKDLIKKEESQEQQSSTLTLKSLEKNLPKYVPKPSIPLNLFDPDSMQVKPSTFGDSFVTFAWKNNANYNEKMVLLYLI